MLKGQEILNYAQAIIPEAAAAASERATLSLNFKEAFRLDELEYTLHLINIVYRSFSDFLYVARLPDTPEYIHGITHALIKDAFNDPERLLAGHNLGRCEIPLEISRIQLYPGWNIEIAGDRVPLKMMFEFISGWQRETVPNEGPVHHGTFDRFTARLPGWEWVLERAGQLMKHDEDLVYIKFVSRALLNPQYLLLEIIRIPDMICELL